MRRTRSPRRRATCFASAVMLALTPGSGLPTGAPPLAAARAFGAFTDSPSGEAAAADVTAPVERGRDPLGLARVQVPPRVWVLLDTSTSMLENPSGRTRLEEAVEVIRWAAATFVSEAGTPLVHWRLAAFESFDPAREEQGPACRDPHYGASLPPGSPPGAPTTSLLNCGGLRLLTKAASCDLEANRTAMLEALPQTANANRTPAGISLYQLALHIRNEATTDLLPGQKNIVLFLTDGVDSCECDRWIWKDFVSGSPGVDDCCENLALRSGDAAPAPVWLKEVAGWDVTAYNAALKAKAAHHALNLDDPKAGLGEIHVIGFDMDSEEFRRGTNHLAWMASNLERPAIHAADRAGLRDALSEVIEAVTLPDGPVALAEPRLAAVKELVGGSPGSAFDGTDPSVAPADLVADPSDPEALGEVLALRAAHRDNVLIAGSARLRELEGGLRALPVPSGGGQVSGPPIWEAGARLAELHPRDRRIWFHRRGETTLRPFTTAEVRPEDLGVGRGYLSEVDGSGARTAADAAEIVVRLVRGEELAVHSGTGSIYDPGGGLHFVGGTRTPKLRESVASPAVVPAPPYLRHRDAAYERFFREQANRRTMIYLPTSGGLLHAFSAETGEEAFAFVPADVLGPDPHVAEDSRATFVRDLAVAGVHGAPGLSRGLASRFTLAGSPVAADVWLEETGAWGTVVAFARGAGGRFATSLDVTDIGGSWVGVSEPVSRWPAAARKPRLLWHDGHRPGGDLFGIRETSAPVVVETPASSGSEWLTFLGGGDGAGDGPAEVFVLAAGDGALRGRFRLPPAPDGAVTPNAVAAPPAVWRPAWATPGATDLVTTVYAADVHGQIHRLEHEDGGGSAWRLGAPGRLGGDHPVHHRPVVFPYPGRTEPHVLVVTGGDRRLPGGPAHLVLLRDHGTRFEEVWREALPAGEAPQSRPVVRADGIGIEIVLPTLTAAAPHPLGCGETRTQEGVSRVRAFDGMTGAPLSGVVAPDAAVLDLGPGQIRGVSLSSTGNMAFSVTQAAGGVIDTVIGDFRFRVRDGALEPITFFVEGFRRSPF